ncbi:S26 family signal peptidase [Pseudomonadota bacterium]
MNFPLELKTVGSSMGLALPSGSVVAVSPKSWYWPGDIIAFVRHDGMLVAHRVIGYRFNSWLPSLITQGDSAPSQDAPIHISRVLGKVASSKTQQRDGSPGVGKVALSMRFSALCRYARLIWKTLHRRAGCE